MMNTVYVKITIFSELRLTLKLLLLDGFEKPESRIYNFNLRKTICDVYHNILS